MVHAWQACYELQGLTTWGLVLDLERVQHVVLIQLRAVDILERSAFSEKSRKRGRINEVALFEACNTLPSRSPLHRENFSGAF
jgi:hypothetical protein